VIALSLVVLHLNGLPNRFPERALAVIDGTDFTEAYQTDLPQAIEGDFPQLGIRKPDSAGFDFVLWGDSHAMSMAELVDELATDHGLSGVIAAHSGTIPLLDVWRPAEGLVGVSKKSWNDKVFDYITEHRVPNVFLASRWAVNVLGRPNGTMDTLIVDNASTAAIPPESQDAFSRSLQKTISSLDGAGSRVWIIGQTPTQYENPPTKLFYAALHEGEVPHGVSLQQHLNRQSTVFDAIQKLDGRFTFLDPTPYCFDESGRSRIGDHSKSYYCDDNHLTTYGARALLKDLLEPAFAEIAAKKGPVDRETRRPAKVVLGNTSLP
jgi:hypothetical protein